MNYVAATFSSEEKNFEWEILTAFLAEIGFETFEENDSELKAYIPEKDFNAALLKALIDEQLNSLNISFKHKFIQDQNWNAVWESNYEAIVIADRCLIRAPFHPTDDSIEYNILIEPQMSFGTAHHETTAMMIEYTLNADLAMRQVLDMGSGTGVLAILSSMRGADKIDAIDIDEWAYKNCISNTEKNSIKNISVIQGDVNAIIKKYDVIFANINLNILVRDMKIYAKALNVNGIIYFSGFYQNDLMKLEQSANRFNLELIDTKVQNDWTAAKFSKMK